MIEQVSPAQLAAWLQARRSHGQPVLLDVREPAEWRTSSVAIDGAELVQMPMQSVPARLHELDASRPVAVLCHHGGRSMQVANYLTRVGFSQVANVAGGIDAWSLQLDPNVPRY